MGKLSFLDSKTYGSLHFYVDYRKLYAVMIRDSYLLPRMRE